VLDGDEVGGSVGGSHAAFVVAEDHVQDPMQSVFDHPVGADHGSDLAGQQEQRGDVETRLTLDLVADLARAFDDDDAFQAGPIVCFL